MVIYMYLAPGQRQTTPWHHFFLQKYKFSINLVICCKFYPLNDFVTVLSIKCRGCQKGPCRKIGQGHYRVIIYINFVDLECPMLHVKFQDHRTSGSGEVFTIYGHGSHLGHVTWTIYINFGSPFPRMLHIKFGFDWPGGFREEDP